MRAASRAPIVPGTVLGRFGSDTHSTPGLNDVRDMCMLLINYKGTVEHHGVLRVRTRTLAVALL
jgi:hypothetical protein